MKILLFSREREYEGEEMPKARVGFNAMTLFTGAQLILYVREYKRSWTEILFSLQNSECKSISDNPNDSELGAEVRNDGFIIISTTIRLNLDIKKTGKHGAVRECSKATCSVHSNTLFYFKCAQKISKSHSAQGAPFTPLLNLNCSDR